jgi:hypothetical protein
VYQHHGLTAKPTRRWLAYAKRKGGGHCRIDRVPAGLEYFLTRIRRAVVCRSDHSNLRSSHSLWLDNTRPA